VCKISCIAQFPKHSRNTQHFRENTFDVTNYSRGHSSLELEKVCEQDLVSLSLRNTSETLNLNTSSRTIDITNFSKGHPSIKLEVYKTDDHLHKAWPSDLSSSAPCLAPKKPNSHSSKRSDANSKFQKTHPPLTAADRVRARSQKSRASQLIVSNRPL
jgi:hypothetical protein